MRIIVAMALFGALGLLLTHWLADTYLQYRGIDYDGLHYAGKLQVWGTIGGIVLGLLIGVVAIRLERRLTSGHDS